MAKSLDFVTAKYGMEMFNNNSNNDKFEPSLRKALAVLDEQGVFAMALWLHTNGDCKIQNQLDELLHDNDTLGFNSNKKYFTSPEGLENIRNDILQDLKLMYFTKNIIRDSMVYALYRSKGN